MTKIIKTTKRVSSPTYVGNKRNIVTTTTTTIIKPKPTCCPPKQQSRFLERKKTLEWKSGWLG